MASVGWEDKRARIVFRDENTKQQTIRLGECPKSVANTACMAVGHLVVAKRHGSVPHPDAVRWLDGIDDVLYARVAAHGLCQPREHAAVETLETLLERFDAVSTVKETTRYKMLQVADSLREFFGADTPLDAITLARADQWRKELADSGLARATVSKRVAIAKGIFGKAVRWGMIPASPLRDLVAGSQSNPDRAFYVDAKTIAAVLDACPDDEWRAIIALSRFAGLRCPSELVGLRWGDILWDKGRMTVRSPKTANHEGHAMRVVPIAPELRPILQSLFDNAEEGAEAVVPRLGDPGINLRTQFHRIIARAGLTAWPRLFHNLRGSCATDWVERFPAHVVAGWLGHSPMIAAQHYLQTRDAHFDLAAGVAEAAANPATQARPSDSTDAQQKAKNPGNAEVLVPCGAECNPLEILGMPPEGLEHSRFSPGNTRVPDSRGSKSGNIGAGSTPPTPPPKPTDPDLAAVVAAWANLPPAVRAGIVAMVGAAVPGGGR